MYEVHIYTSGVSPKSMHQIHCSTLRLTLVYLDQWHAAELLGNTERLSLLQLSNIANLTCVGCGVQTSKITIIFYININLD